MSMMKNQIFAIKVGYFIEEGEDEEKNNALIAKALIEFVRTGEVSEMIQKKTGVVVYSGIQKL